MSLVKKFKNIHVQSLLGSGSMSVCNFILVAMLFRSLTTEEIGVWFFFQTSLAFIDTFRQGFLTTTFVKFYTGTSPSRGKEVIGSTWYIASTITAVFIFISIPLFFLLPVITNFSLFYFFKYYALHMALSLPMIIAMCICQGQMRFDRLLYIKVLQVVVLIVIVLFLNFHGSTTLDHLMYANLFSIAVASIMVFMKKWSGVESFWAKTNQCTADLIKFGRFTVGSSLTNNLFGICNTYVIVFFLGPAALAIYNLGYRLIEIVEIPLRSFIATALPTLSFEHNEGNKENLIALMKRYIGAITISLIPLLVIAAILADLGMAIIGGGKYENSSEGVTAANVFRILSLYSLLYPLDRFLAVTLDVIHKPEINLIKIIVMLVVNVLSSLLGIYLLGDIYGVIIGTVFPTLTAIFISYLAIQKYYLKFSLKDVFSGGYFFIKDLIVRNVVLPFLKPKGIN